MVPSNLAILFLVLNFLLHHLNTLTNVCLLSDFVRIVPGRCARLNDHIDQCVQCVARCDGVISGCGEGYPVVKAIPEYFKIFCWIPLIF